MFQKTDFWIGLAVGAVAGVFGYRFMQERQQQMAAFQQAAPAGELPLAELQRQKEELEDLIAAQEAKKNWFFLSREWRLPALAVSLCKRGARGRKRLGFEYIRQFADTDEFAGYLHPFGGDFGLHSGQGALAQPESRE